MEKQGVPLGIKMASAAAAISMTLSAGGEETQAQLVPEPRETIMSDTSGSEIVDLKDFDKFTIHQTDRVTAQYVLFEDEIKWPNDKLGFKSNESELLQRGQEAFSQWFDVSGLKELVDGDDISMNYIYKRPDDWAEFVIATTDCYIIAPKEMNNCEIEILKDERWENFPLEIQNAVILHEVRHALRIDHSESLPSVMAPWVEDMSKELQEDDVNAIQALYGPQEASLQYGWNLIVFDENKMKNGDFDKNEWASVYAWDSNNQNWHKWAKGAPDYVNDLRVLKNGQAAWVLYVPNP